MARFIKGEVVVLPFTFSDLSQAKRRLALVIAELEGNDLILCQITSREIMDRYVISINDNDFESSGLRRASNIRPNGIVTADSHIVL
jgi:mRNA interferase MazF